MTFRVSGRGRAASMRRRMMAVARLGEKVDAPGPFVLRPIPRFRLRSLLLRSQRALARLREYYADVMRGLIAEAAAAESAKARGRSTTEAVAPERPLVVPAAIAGTVLRCNSHYYIR